MCLELQCGIAFFSRFGTDIGEFSSLVLGTACQFGTDIGEFSSLVLGTAYCALGTDIVEFSSLVLGTTCCALAVPFLLCPVWRLLVAVGNGAMRRSSISCRKIILTLLCYDLKLPRKSLAFGSDVIH